MAAPDSTNAAGEPASQGAPVEPRRSSLSQPALQQDAPTSAGQPMITPIQPKGPDARHPAPGAAAPQSDGEVPADDEAEEGMAEEIAEIALKNAPPWLVSALFHTLLMIVLALVLLPSMMNNQVDLEATFSDRLGEQLEFDSPLAGNDLENVEEPVITPDDMLMVEDPFAAPPTVDVDILPGQSMTSSTVSPNIGLALNGRQPGMKKALLAAFGGNKLTQESVAAGLKWLVRNQQKDGSWSLIGPYADGARNENREAATAMALLAFQGDGNTTEYGEYKNVVKRGWYYLLKQQDGDGCFFRQGAFGHRFYTHGQATIAICELFAMTKDKTLRASYKEPAEKAIAYCAKTQSPAGGWKYTVNGPSDLSVTGWILMGLQSARMAGLEVPPKTLAGITKYLDHIGQNGGSRYPYEIGRDSTRAMTAEGLLCRQYLGWKRNNPILLEGVNWLSRPENQLSYTNGRDVYYWYYATQLMHHMEGEPWEKWNRAMCQVVPKAQVQTGREAGSWDPSEPTPDEWGGEGGRLFVSCLSMYMLEVYYRHLPLYSNPFMYMQ